MPQAETYDDLREGFDPVWSDEHEWVNVHDGQALRAHALDELLAKYLPGETAIVVVHAAEGVGARLNRSEVSAFVAPHVLTAEIQISDPSHSCCVAILINGVAAGWARNQPGRAG